MSEEDTRTSAVRWMALSKGFIMVWPNGVRNSWNVGRCCGTAQSQNVDDVGFTRAMIKWLEGQAYVDPKRIYATRCSNGGGMAYMLACNAADVIAAVAPVDCDCITGPMSTPSCGNCSPARPISATQFRGTSDTVVPYNGGPTPVVQGLMFPGAPTNFSTWASIGMCTGSPSANSINSACQTYTTCGGGTETTLCTVQNGMHCGNYNSFGIVNIAWQMFQKEALP